MTYGASHRRLQLLGQLLLIYCWLAHLAKTDSYFSVYLLCAVAAVLCACDLYTRRPAWAVKTFVGASVFALLFALATVAANYALFEPLAALFSKMYMTFSLAGGYCVGMNILLWTLSRAPWEKVAPRAGAGRVFAAVFCSVCAIDLAYLLFAAYPGVLTTDSVSTMVQIAQGDYNNTMPFWHTMTVKLFYEVGMLLFRDINAAVALFHSGQILFLAACFAFAVATLYQAGANRGFLAAVWAVYALTPYNIVYSVTLWKDVPFGGAALLFTTALYRLLRGIGSARRSLPPLILGALGLCLWRTNGWYAFTVAALVLTLVLGRREKRLAALLWAVVILCWVLLNPVLWALEVEGTDLMEALAVPFQQLARVVATGQELTQEEEALLSQMFHLDQVAELYNPHTVDPIKYEAFRHENREAIQAGLGRYVRLYLELGLRYPGQYLMAWIDETKGYWNGGYDYWIYNAQGIDTNDLGLICSGGGNAIASAFAAWFRYMEKPAVLQFLYSIGLQSWLVIGCAAVNALKKRREWLLSMPLVVLLAGLWLGTPVYAEFRYAYPVFLTAPLILGATVFSPAPAAIQAAPPAAEQIQ